MSDISQVITQIINHPWAIVLISLLAIAGILWINRKRLQLAWFNFKTRYCLNHLGLEQMSNIRCPDGLGEYFNIDRLILRHDGITLLVFKQYPGKIFCADQIDEWTQMVGQKSYHFKNPLYDLEYQVKAIATCAPMIDVDGYLFFDHLAEFPKGHPQRVIHPKQIPDSLKRNNRHQVEMPVMEAWRRFQAMASQS